MACRSSDQRLGQVRDHVERAVPERHVDVEVEPRLDTGHRSLQHHDASQGVRVTAGECVRDPAADVVTDHGDLLEAQLLGELEDVLGQVDRVVAGRRRRRAAHATLIDRDHGGPTWPAGA